MNWLWKGVDSYFCAWPCWICICRSFPFRRKMYGRRVFKWITQCDLQKFALVKLLAFAPLFYIKKHLLNYFALEMAAIAVAWRRHRRERREHGRRRGFFPTRIDLFGMPEEHFIRTYWLPSHVIFNLHQEIKDNLEPLTRSLATLHFVVSGSF